MVSVTSLMMVSCGSDDEDEPQNSDYEKLIVGTWSTDGTDDWGSKDNYEVWGFIFKDNGECYVYEKVYGWGTYTIEGSKITMTFYSNLNETETWTHEILKLTDDMLITNEDVYYRVK